MSDSTRSDKKPVPNQPGPPGIGTPFAGESSPGNIPSQENPPQFDPNATIIDTTSRFDPAAQFVDADATIIDFQVKKPDANATVPPVNFVRPSPSPRSPSPGTIANSKASAAETMLGELLGGRYQLLQLLGEGGMGAVYKARDLELEREVALKVIKPEMADHPEILQRFKQELILARQVTDRNVIRIFDIGEAGGIKFITMEYLEGENLNQILSARGKLEITEAVGIMEQVACGLAAAHREGIIHRDLKPGNIMRDKSGRVVVMDFGLARTFSGDGMTRAGAMLGTIEYMSPEQAQGMELKASSDIFTFGLILYELLAGVTPFYAESAIASLLKRTQQRAVPLAEVDKHIPGKLSNIVSKCLEKDPANRYQNAEELDADLRAWQGRGGGNKVSASSAQLRLNRIRELPWPRLAIAGILILAIAAGIAWYVIERQPSARLLAHAPVSVLVGDFANHTGDPVLDNTLEPMLGVALEGASFINSYSRGDARKQAGKLPNPSDKLDEQSARLVAVNQGVNAVITGDISLRGDQYEISAVALDAVSGKVLAKAEVTVADKQQILSDLPKVAAPLRQALGDTTAPSVQFGEVSGGFTAASLEAVHQDALGVDEQFAGKFQEAFDSFQKAAELDPKFARAYTGMAAMAQNLGRPGDAVKYMNLAMEHVDRMTERERYRNRGLYYLTTGDWQKCVQEYSQLVTHYPADRVGQNNLASCYTQVRNAPKALEAAQHAVEIVPKGVGPRLNLAFISAFAGDFAASEKQARTALDISPSAAQGYLALAEAQLGQGQVEKAADTYHQLEKSGPLGASTANAGLADLAAYQGKYEEASRLLTQGATADLAAKMSDNAARKYAALANMDELQGHHATALSEVASALANSQSTQIEFLAASIDVDAGDLPKAQKLATSLSSALTSESQAYGKIVAGLIALKRKDPNEAVKQITAANNLLDTWIGRFDLGRAYLEAGAFTEADSEFDQCAKRRGEAIELFMDNVPTYSYFPAVYYYQGRVREGMKSEGFADFYKTYLSIRGQSLDDPLVQEIHRRIGK
ncbi:protein kinase [Telmatobacter sp. DSM 110680]|uniref:non-specific serine/threonine protein kinase n=1 Tax=Telmatobacter sp. DSM 110680 TaxID=3036704 RepID=A0AAU7DK36_9BACT